MDRELYLQSLPKKYMGAGALVLNEQGKMLILHPTYKDRWEICGGIVEQDESPRQACIREIKEEIGLDLEVGKLLCLDYSVNAEGLENLQFIFDGGVLTQDQIQRIELAPDEIARFEFVAMESEEDKQFILARNRLGPRLLKAIEAKHTGTFYYLEKGEPCNGGTTT